LRLSFDVIVDVRSNMKLKLDHGNVVTERMGYSGLAVNREQSISRRSEKREK